MPSTLRLGSGWPPVLDKAGKPERVSLGFAARLGACSAWFHRAWHAANTWRWGDFIGAFEAGAGARSPTLPPPANWPCYSITLLDLVGPTSNRAWPNTKGNTKSVTLNICAPLQNTLECNCFQNQHVRRFIGSAMSIAGPKKGFAIPASMSWRMSVT